MNFLARYIVVCLSALAILLSNVAWNPLHATAMTLGADVQNGEVQDSADLSKHAAHAHDTTHKAPTSAHLDREKADDFGTKSHHDEDATPTCCAVACASAILLPAGPRLPSVDDFVLVHLDVDDTAHAADQGRHDRPPRTLQA